MKRSWSGVEKPWPVKSIALFTFVAFLSTQIFLPSPTALARSSEPSAQAIVPPFQIPPEFGKIDEVYCVSRDSSLGTRQTNNPDEFLVPSPESRFLVFIQDAHDSLEAQENIAKIIDLLVKEKGIRTVFEEGYEGRVPTDEFFGDIKDPIVRQKVSYFLLDKLRIGGAEYAHINRKTSRDSFLAPRDSKKQVPSPESRATVPDWNLIGVDSLKLYAENLRSYQRSSVNRRETEEDISELFAQVTALAHQFFPTALKAWIKGKERFSEGKLPLLDYLRELRSLRLKATDSYSSILFSVEYPAMTLLLKAQDSKDKKLIGQLNALDSKVVFDEMLRLEQDASGAFLKNARAKKIFDYYQGLGLLKRLNRIELTQAEYESVKETLKKLETQKMADFIATLTHKSLALSRSWEQFIQDPIHFYDVAQARDRSLANALNNYLFGDTNHEPRDTKKEERGADTAILVFGGFHSNAIKELLRKQGLSYVVISPRITSLDKKHQDYYKQLMTVGHHSFETPFLVARANKPPGVLYDATQIGNAPVLNEIAAIASQVVSLGDHAVPTLVERGLSASTSDARSEIRVFSADFSTIESIGKLKALKTKDDVIIQRLTVLMRTSGDAAIRETAGRKIVEEALGDEYEALRLEALSEILPPMIARVNLPRPSEGEVDLHSHTYRSDAYDPPAAYILHAFEEGLRGAAITDHDRLPGEEAQKAVEILNQKIREVNEKTGRNVSPLTLIPGIEITTFFKGVEVHFPTYLPQFYEGYAGDKKKILESFAAKLKGARAVDGPRAERIMRWINEHHPEFSLTLEELNAIYRYEKYNSGVGDAIWEKYKDDPSGKIALAKYNIKSGKDVWYNFIAPHVPVQAMTEEEKLKFPTLDELLDFAHAVGAKFMVAHPNEIIEQKAGVFEALMQDLAKAAQEGNIAPENLLGVEMYSHKITRSPHKDFIWQHFEALNATDPYYRDHPLLSIPGSDSHGLMSWPSNPLGRFVQRSAADPSALPYFDHLLDIILQPVLSSRSEARRIELIGAQGGELDPGQFESYFEKSWSENAFVREHRGKIPERIVKGKFDLALDPASQGKPNAQGLKPNRPVDLNRFYFRKIQKFLDERGILARLQAFGKKYFFVPPQEFTVPFHTLMIADDEVVRPNIQTQEDLDVALALADKNPGMKFLQNTEWYTAEQLHIHVTTEALPFEKLLPHAGVIGKDDGVSLLQASEWPLSHVVFQDDDLKELAGSSMKLIRILQKEQIPHWTVVLKGKVVVFMGKPNTPIAEVGAILGENHTVHVLEAAGIVTVMPVKKDLTETQIDQAFRAASLDPAVMDNLFLKAGFSIRSEVRDPTPSEWITCIRHKKAIQRRDDQLMYLSDYMSRDEELSLIPDAVRTTRKYGDFDLDYQPDEWSEGSDGYTYPQGGWHWSIVPPKGESAEAPAPKVSSRRNPLAQAVDVSETGTMGKDTLLKKILELKAVSEKRRSKLTREKSHVMTMSPPEELRVLLNALSDPVWRVKGDVAEAALNAIHSLRENKAAFSEPNLAQVLSMLSSPERDIREYALRVMPYFVQADKKYATQINLEKVLATKDYIYEGVYKFKAIPSFLLANKKLASGKNLNKVLGFLSIHSAYRDALEAVHQVVSCFVQVNKGAFSSRLLGRVLSRRWFGSLDANVSRGANDAMAYFFKANRAAFSKEHLRKVLSFLKRTRNVNDAHFRGIKALGYFVQANKDYATEGNLAEILQDLNDRHDDFSRYWALETIPYFLLAGPSAFTETNLKKLMSVLEDLQRPPREEVWQALPYFIEANNPAIPERLMEKAKSALKRYQGRSEMRVAGEENVKARGELNPRTGAKKNRSEVRNGGDYAKKQQSFYDAMRRKRDELVAQGHIPKPRRNGRVLNISLDAGYEDVSGEFSDLPIELVDALEGVAREIEMRFPQFKVTKRGGFHATLFDIAQWELSDDQDDPKQLDSATRKILQEVVKARGTITPFRVHLKGIDNGPAGSIVVNGFVEGDTLGDLRTQLSGLAQDRERWANEVSFHITLARLERPIEPVAFTKLLDWVRERREKEFPSFEVRKPVFVATGDNDATRINEDVQKELFVFNSHSKMRDEAPTKELPMVSLDEFLASDFKGPLIIGGTGMIGVHLLERLAREGRPVAVPIRAGASEEHLQHLRETLASLEKDGLAKRVTLVEVGNALDPMRMDPSDASYELLKKLLSKATAVYHLAAQTRVRPDKARGETYESFAVRTYVLNVFFTKLIARATKELGVPMVYSSSQEVFSLNHLFQTPMATPVTEKTPIPFHPVTQAFMDEIQKAFDVYVAQFVKGAASVSPLEFTRDLLRKPLVQRLDEKNKWESLIEAVNLLDERYYPAKVEEGHKTATQQPKVTRALEKIGKRFPLDLLFGNYAISKLLAEKDVLELAQAWAFRFVNVYGKGMHPNVISFYLDHLKKNQERIGRGEAPLGVHFTDHARDFMAAAELAGVLSGVLGALESQGKKSSEVIHVGTGHVYTMLEVLKNVAAFLGVDLPALEEHGDQPLKIMALSGYDTLQNQLPDTQPKMTLEEGLRVASEEKRSEVRKAGATEIGSMLRSPMILMGRDLTQSWLWLVRNEKIMTTTKDPGTGQDIKYGVRISKDRESVEQFATDLATGKDLQDVVLEKRVGPFRANFIWNRSLRPSTFALQSLEERRQRFQASHDPSTCSFDAGPLALKNRPEVARITAQDHRIWQVYQNVSPIDERGGYLLIPDLSKPENLREQRLAKEDISDLTEMSFNSSGLTIYFEGGMSGASQNHIHAKVYPGTVGLGEGFVAVRDAGSRVLTEQFSKELPGLTIEADAKDSEAFVTRWSAPTVKALSQALSAVLPELDKTGLPFSVAWSGKSAWLVVREPGMDVLPELPGETWGSYQLINRIFSMESLKNFKALTEPGIRDAMNRTIHSRQETIDFFAKMLEVRRSEMRAGNSLGLKMNSLKTVVITVDGPAGSGKGTLAAELAKRLGYLHFDSGALYRAIAYAAILKDINPNDPVAVAQMLDRTKITFDVHKGAQRVLIDGQDVMDFIRNPQVDLVTPRIAVHREVQKRVLQIVREIGEAHDSVMDGRQMGTDVFPDATGPKFYVDVAAEVRAQRRAAQYAKNGKTVDLAAIMKSILDRDAADKERPFAPLRQPEDAIVIDNGAGRSVAETVDEMERLVRKHLLNHGFLGNAKAWVVSDPRTGAEKGVVYQTPRLPKDAKDLEAAWRDFHEMVFEFPKLLEHAAKNKLPVVLAIPEKLDGFGPLADEAPWIEGARTALAWASAYFRFKELGNVDVRVLQLPAGNVPQATIAYAVKKLLSKDIRDAAGTPEEQMESRMFRLADALTISSSGSPEFSLELQAIRTITGEEQIGSSPEMIRPDLPPVPQGKKRIVVTGAAGFLGINMVRRLLAEGNQVIALDDMTTANKDFPSFLNNEPNLYFRKWDVSQSFDIEGPVDQVIHLASLASPPDYYVRPLETLRSGLQGTRVTAELALSKHARFLFTSTSEVYGDAKVHPQAETYEGNVSPFLKRSQYDQSKRGGETLMKLYAERYADQMPDFRIARPFNTYGPFMRLDDGRAVTNFIEKVLEGKPIEIYGSKSITRSFGYVDDTVEGLLKLLRTDILTPATPIRDRVFNVGNDGEFTLGELADLVNELGQKYLGRTVPVHVVELKDPSDPVRRRPDLSRARQVLGYAPSVSLREGLEKTFLYFLKDHSSERSRSEIREKGFHSYSEFLEGIKEGKVTFAMIKPDGLARKEEIVRKFQEAGFEVYMADPVRLDERTVREFYKIHHARSNFEGLVQYMTSGEVIPVLLVRPANDAAQLFNEKKKAIRKELQDTYQLPTTQDFGGHTIQLSVFHASDPSDEPLRQPDGKNQVAFESELVGANLEFVGPMSSSAVRRSEVRMDVIMADLEESRRLLSERKFDEAGMKLDLLAKHFRSIVVSASYHEIQTTPFLLANYFAATLLFEKVAQRSNQYRSVRKKRSIQILAIDPEGNVLLQKRGLYKQLFASKYAVSANAKPGEKDDDQALIEAKVKGAIRNEIGIECDSTRLLRMGKDYAHQHYFRGQMFLAFNENEAVRLKQIHDALKGSLPDGLTLDYDETKHALIVYVLADSDVLKTTQDKLVRNIAVSSEIPPLPPVENLEESSLLLYPLSAEEKEQINEIRARHARDKQAVEEGKELLHLGSLKLIDSDDMEWRSLQDIQRNYSNDHASYAEDLIAIYFSKGVDVLIARAMNAYKIMKGLPENLKLLRTLIGQSKLEDAEVMIRSIDEQLEVFRAKEDVIFAEFQPYFLSSYFALRDLRNMLKGSTERRIAPFQVMVFDSKGRILVGRQGPGSELYPSKLDIPLGGVSAVDALRSQLSIEPDPSRFTSIGVSGQFKHFFRAYKFLAFNAAEDRQLRIFVEKYQGSMPGISVDYDPIGHALVLATLKKSVAGELQTFAERAARETAIPYLRPYQGGGTTTLSVYVLNSDEEKIIASSKLREAQGLPERERVSLSSESLERINADAYGFRLWWDVLYKFREQSSSFVDYKVMPYLGILAGGRSRNDDQIFQPVKEAVFRNLSVLGHLPLAIGDLLHLDHPDSGDKAVSGGKGSNLHFLRMLAKAEQDANVSKPISVPEGYILPAKIFEQWVLNNPKHPKLKRNIERLQGISEGLIKAKAVAADPLAVDQEEAKLSPEIMDLLKDIRKEIESIELPSDLRRDIKKMMRALQGDSQGISVAVRSTATVEDSLKAACAGKGESKLGNRTSGEVEDAIKVVWASLFSDRFVEYRINNGMQDTPIMPVVILKMINAQAAGTVFSVDTVTGRPALKINAKPGLGEGVVSGSGLADQWIVSPDGKMILEETINPKTEKIIMSKGGSTERITITDPKEQEQPSLKLEIVTAVAEISRRIQKQYASMKDVPDVDIEFAQDGEGIHIVQTRPETTVPNSGYIVVKTVDESKVDAKVKRMQLPDDSVIGFPGVAIGKLKIRPVDLDLPDEKKRDRIISIVQGMKAGDILVTQETDNSWDNAFFRVAGVITENGNTTSHAAVTAREREKACLVGARKVVGILKAFDDVFVVFDSGTKTIFYRDDGGSLNVPIKEVRIPLKIWKSREMLLKKPAPILRPEWKTDDEYRAFYSDGKENYMKDFEGEWRGRPKTTFGYLELDYYNRAFEEYAKMLNALLRDGCFRAVSRKFKQRIIYSLLKEEPDSLQNLLYQRDLDDYEKILAARVARFLKAGDFFEGLPENGVISAANTGKAMDWLIELLGWMHIARPFHTTFQEKFWYPQAHYFNAYELSISRAGLERAALRLTPDLELYWKEKLTHWDKVKEMAAIEEMIREDANAQRLFTEGNFEELEKRIKEKSPQEEGLYDALWSFAHRFKAADEDIRKGDDLGSFLREFQANLTATSQLAETISIPQVLRLVEKLQGEGGKPADLWQFISRREILARIEQLDRKLYFALRLLARIRLVNSDGRTRVNARDLDEEMLNLIGQLREERELEKKSEDVYVKILAGYPKLRKIVSINVQQFSFMEDAHQLITRYQKKLYPLLIGLAKRHPWIFGDRPEQIFDLSTVEVAALARFEAPTYLQLTFVRHQLEEAADAKLEADWKISPDRAIENYYAATRHIIQLLEQQRTESHDERVATYYNSEIKRINDRGERLKKQVLVRSEIRAQLDSQQKIAVDKRAEVRVIRTGVTEQEINLENKSAKMVQAIRKSVQPAMVFVDAQDFASLSAAQKREYLLVALSNKHVHFVIYNEHGQDLGKEFRALLNADHVTRTGEGLGRAVEIFSKPNIPAVQLSKQVLPDAGTVRSLAKRVMFFKQPDEKSGTLGVALLWAISGEGQARIAGVSRGGDGFWTVAENLLSDLERAYTSRFALSIAA